MSRIKQWAQTAGICAALCVLVPLSFIALAVILIVASVAQTASRVFGRLG